MGFWNRIPKRQNSFVLRIRIPASLTLVDMKLDYKHSHMHGWPIFYKELRICSIFQRSNNFSRIKQIQKNALIRLSMVKEVK